MMNGSPASWIVRLPPLTLPRDGRSAGHGPNNLDCWIRINMTVCSQRQYVYVLLSGKIRLIILISYLILATKGFVR
mgnify:CR=1 FL=1